MGDELYMIIILFGGAILLFKIIFWIIDSLGGE
jgi:hypothetical protein